MSRQGNLLILMGHPTRKVTIPSATDAPERLVDRGSHPPERVRTGCRISGASCGGECDSVKVRSGRQFSGDGLHCAPDAAALIRRNRPGPLRLEVLFPRAAPVRRARHDDELTGLHAQATIDFCIGHRNPPDPPDHAISEKTPSCLCRRIFSVVVPFWPPVRWRRPSRSEGRHRPQPPILRRPSSRRRRGSGSCSRASWA